MSYPIDFQDTKWIKLSVLLLLLLTHNIGFASMPTQIGGFILDTDIADYDKLIKTETIQPIRFNEALNEAEIHQIPGFKSGYIAYGTCDSLGKIARIKLKYQDSSKDFYEKLLETFEDRFGKPKWLGDSFHVVSIWKWSFEESGTRVDLYLQHNLSKKDEKVGNSVKMTMLNLVQDELDCFEKKNPSFRKSKELKVGDKPVTWEDLLPK